MRCSASATSPPALAEPGQSSPVWPGSPSPLVALTLLSSRLALGIATAQDRTIAAMQAKAHAVKSFGGTILLAVGTWLVAPGIFAGFFARGLAVSGKLGKIRLRPGSRLRGWWQSASTSRRRSDTPDVNSGMLVGCVLLAAAGRPKYELIRGDEEERERCGPDPSEWKRERVRDALGDVAQK